MANSVTAFLQAGKYFDASTNRPWPTLFFEPCGAGLPGTKKLSTLHFTAPDGRHDE